MDLKKSKEFIEDWLTVKEFCEKYSNCIETKHISKVMRNPKKHGAEYFSKVVDDKTLISPQLFFIWLVRNVESDWKEANGGKATVKVEIALIA